jgi:hypothetical protein
VSFFGVRTQRSVAAATIRDCGSAYREAGLPNVLRFRLRGLFGADLNRDLASGQLRRNRCAQLKHSVALRGLELVRFHPLG